MENEWKFRDIGIQEKLDKNATYFIGYIFEYVLWIWDARDPIPKPIYNYTHELYKQWISLYLLLLSCVSEKVKRNTP